MPFERQIYNDIEASDFSGTSFAHATDAPFYQLSLWPYRSLSRRGFVWFIGLTAGLISLPLLALLGSTYMWVMLPFLAAAVAAIWYFIERSYKDGQILEVLTIWSDQMELTRQNPRGEPQYWQANPYWVEVKMQPTNGPNSGPVENYITLRGNDREVEIGAFLSADERKILLSELQAVLARLPK